MICLSPLPYPHGDSSSIRIGSGATRPQSPFSRGACIPHRGRPPMLPGCRPFSRSARRGPSRSRCNVRASSRGRGPFRPLARAGPEAPLPPLWPPLLSLSAPSRLSGLPHAFAFSRWQYQTPHHLYRRRPLKRACVLLYHCLFAESEIPLPTAAEYLLYALSESVRRAHGNELGGAVKRRVLEYRVVCVVDDHLAEYGGLHYGGRPGHYEEGLPSCRHLERDRLPPPV